MKLLGPTLAPVAIGVVTAVVALAVGGCGEPDSGPPPVKMDAARVEKSMKSIDADANISPQAKEAAKAGLRAAQAASENARGGGPASGAPR